MFEPYSDRSRMIVFLTRRNAGRRGSACLEAGHLLAAIVLEDQGELPAIFSGAVTSSGPLRPPERSFFSAEAAKQILAEVDRILPVQGEAKPDSVDMACSSALSKIFAGATALAKELQHDKVEPLHLVAAMFSGETDGLAGILINVGISRELVIAALPG